MYQQTAYSIRIADLLHVGCLDSQNSSQAEQRARNQLSMRDKGEGRCLLYDTSISSKHAVIQNDSMNDVHSCMHIRREVSMAPPMTRSLSQSRRAEKESRKDRMAGKLSGDATAADEWRSVPFCATPAVALLR